jgi:hypothetical protein
VSGEDAAAGVLNRRAERGVHSQPPRRFEVDIRGGLAAGDLLGGDRGLEEVSETRELQHHFYHRAVCGRGQPERPPRRYPLYGLAGAGDQGQVLAVESLHPLYDGGRDLLGKITALIFPLTPPDYLKCAVYSRNRFARRRLRVLPLVETPLLLTDSTSLVRRSIEQAFIFL